MSMTTTKNTENTDKSENKKSNFEALNSYEKKLRFSCEASIRAGLKSYQNVGKALTVIATDRLYRSTHSTMVNYARDRWDMTTARVSQLQHAYRVHELLTLHDLSPKPVTESQCRPLARIPSDEFMDEKILKVWNAVIDAKEKITALLINAQVDIALGVEPKQEQEQEQDTAGAGAQAGDNPSASAENRAEIRDLKKKIAYLESALEAEKTAHQRTQAAGGVPRSRVAKELFKAGFRVMAKKCHPDAGGTAAEMQELNKVKEALNI